MADLSTRLAMVVTKASSMMGGTQTPPVVTPPVVTPPVVTPPVVTPPVVTPPVTTPPASTGSYVALLKDDYTAYKSTADFQAKITSNIGGTGKSNLIYTDGANPKLAEIDETVLYNGHHTVKYNQPGGQASTPELWVGFPEALAHVWFKTTIRFNPGWSTIGSGMTMGDGGKLVPSSNAYKLLGWSYTISNPSGLIDASGRIEITNTTQYQNYWGGSYRSGGHAFGGGNTACGDVGSEWSDGLFYTYVIEIDNTLPTGITRLYIGKNGAKPVFRGACTGTMDKGGLVPTISGIMLGMNYNQVRKDGQNQSLNYGGWEVVDGGKYANPFGV